MFINTSLKWFQTPKIQLKWTHYLIQQSIRRHLSLVWPEKKQPVIWNPLRIPSVKKSDTVKKKCRHAPPLPYCDYKTKLVNSCAWRGRFSRSGVHKYPPQLHPLMRAAMPRRFIWVCTAGRVVQWRHDSASRIPGRWDVRLSVKGRQNHKQR